MLYQLNYCRYEANRMHPEVSEAHRNPAFESLSE